MTDRTANFTFNTAITDVDADGKWNENAHGNLIRPLHARIKGIDGVYFCFIARYGMEVKYIAEAIDLETLDRKVKEAVEWAAGQEGFFPKREQKQPQAILAQSKSPFETVTVQFGTHCLAYPVGGQSEFDRPRFKFLVTPLVSALTDTDGIVDCAIEMSWARLTYDSRITDDDRVVEHLEEVIDQQAEAENNFFPYVKDGTGELCLLIS